jgi:hypothetical protein
MLIKKNMVFWVVQREPDILEEYITSTFRFKSKPSKKPVGTDGICLAYSLILKMEEMCPSEMSGHL